MTNPAADTATEAAPATATRISGVHSPPVEGPDAARASLRRRLQWLMGGRLLVVTLLLGGTLVLAPDPARGVDAFTPRLLLTLIAGTYGASLALAIWLPRSKSLPALAGAQITWDLILITGLVYVSGGAASGFTFLFGIEILMAALIVGTGATQGTAFASLLLYTVVGISVASGWMPQPPDQPPERYLLSVEAVGFALMTNLVGLLLVTILSTNLASRLRRTGGQLRIAAQNVASLARLNDDIVRSLTSGLLTTDPSGAVETVNRAGTEMFGCDEAAVIGVPVAELLPDGSGRPRDDMQEGHRVEGLARRPDGATFPVGFTENHLVDAEGRRTGLLVTFQDLTELHELRRAALRSERLATLGRLAAGLAHEIRNPLSSISGSVELVKESQGLSEEDGALLGIVISEVERLNNLVTTMLQVGRPKPPELARRDLSQLVEQVVQMADRGPASAAHVSVETRGTDRPMWANIDADQIRQVLWNLLKNALQAAPKGSSVRISVGRAGDGGAEVSVQDEGAGISRETRAHLFDTFYSGRPHGVGLGLALVKQIADAHGAEVSVASDEGHGARFSLRFPPS